VKTLCANILAALSSVISAISATPRGPVFAKSLKDGTTALPFGQADCLDHRLGILAAVLQRLELEAGTIHAGVPRSFFGQKFFELVD